MGEVRFVFGRHHQVNAALAMRAIPRNKIDSVTFGGPEDVQPQASVPTKFSENHTRSQIVIAGPDQFSHMDLLQQNKLVQQQNPYAGRKQKGSFELTDRPQGAPEPVVAHRACAGRGTRSSVELTDEPPEGCGKAPPQGYWLDANGDLRRAPARKGVACRSNFQLSGVREDAPVVDFPRRHAFDKPALCTGARLFGCNGSTGQPDESSEWRGKRIGPHPPGRVQEVAGFGGYRGAAPCQPYLGTAASQGPGAPDGPPKAAVNVAVQHGARLAAPPRSTSEPDPHQTWRHQQLQAGLQAVHPTNPPLDPPRATPGELTGGRNANQLYDAELRRWVPPTHDAAVAPAPTPIPSRVAPIGERIEAPYWGTTNQRAFGNVGPPLPHSALDPSVENKGRIPHSFTRGFIPARPTGGLNV